MAKDREERGSSANSGEAPKEQAKPDDAEANGGRGRGRALKALALVVILGCLGFFGLQWRRTAPGEACSRAWQCKSQDGLGSPECRDVVGRGKLCVLPCDKSKETGACPEGFSCDQILWEEAEEPKTAWFCLRRKLMP